MKQLTFEDAMHRRDAGIDRSAKSAGSRWVRLAKGYLLEYLASAPGEFLTEQFREFAAARGLEAPPDGRAFGHVMRAAHREGLVIAAGYAKAKTSNLSPKVLWRGKS